LVSRAKMILSFFLIVYCFLLCVSSGALHKPVDSFFTYVRP
jgi:hypothetical protein